MLTSVVVRVVRWTLKRADLSPKDRNLLTGMLLEKLHAAPLHAILEVNEEGVMLVSGQPLDIEKGRQLQSSAGQALRNPALSLIREQVMYLAFVGSAIKSAEINDMAFYRAALWWCQEVEKLLKLLAQKSEESDLD